MIRISTSRRAGSSREEPIQILNMIMHIAFKTQKYTIILKVKIKSLGVNFIL